LAARPDLEALETELWQLCQPTRNRAAIPDPFLPYLYGMVLIDRARRDEARQTLSVAVMRYPCNWDAWMVGGLCVMLDAVPMTFIPLSIPLTIKALVLALCNVCIHRYMCALQALQSICDNPAMANDLVLPNHFAKRFFMASLCVEQQRSVEALTHLQVKMRAMNQCACAFLLACPFSSSHYNCLAFLAQAHSWVWSVHWHTFLRCCELCHAQSGRSAPASAPLFALLSPMQALAPEFPGTEFVPYHVALAHANLQNFDEAQEMFDELLERDPHRIEVGGPHVCVWGGEGTGKKGWHAFV
jgi:hypothetical protein